jgi:hypothetical protein
MITFAAATCTAIEHQLQWLLDYTDPARKIALFTPHAVVGNSQLNEALTGRTTLGAEPSTDLTAWNRQARVTMVHCPICKVEASPPLKTGPNDGFDCPNHGRFKVSETVLDVPAFRDAPRQQWETALKRAKALPQIPGLPCITSYHF